MRRLIFMATLALIFSALLSVGLASFIIGSGSSSVETASANVDPNEKWAITLNLDINVQGQKEEKVVFGANKDCLDTFKTQDGQCDEPRTTFVTPNIQAYFFYPDETVVVDFFDTKKLIRSIIVPASTMEWWLQIVTDRAVEVTLTPAGIDPNNPPEIAGRDVELLEGIVSGNEVSAGAKIADLRTSGPVTIEFTASGTKNFVVRVVAPAPKPPPPQLIFPGSGDRINDSTPRFVWGVGSGDFDNYILRVTSGDIENGPFDIAETVPKTTTADEPTTPLADASYRWTVRTEKAGGTGSDFAAPFSFTVDATPPTPPTLDIPKSGDAFNTRTVTFRWNLSGSDDVVAQSLQVTSGDTFNPHLDVDKPLGPLVTGDQVVLSADGVYNWRVVARDAALNMGASETRTFTVDTAAPDGPGLVSPVDNALLNTRTIDFEWDISASGDVVAQFFQVTSGDTSVLDKQLGAAVTGEQLLLLADGAYQLAGGSPGRRPEHGCLGAQHLHRGHWNSFRAGAGLS